MEAFIRSTAYGVLSCVIQLGVGSLLAIPLYKAGIYWRTKQSGGPLQALLFFAVSALLGMLLPLNIYGHLPLVLALLAAGFSFAETAPLLIAGTLFNMTIPYTDPGFSWQTGMGRLGIAFGAGILAGILLKRFAGSAGLLRREASGISKEGGLLFCWSEASRLLQKNLSAFALFILIGVIFNQLFFKYVLWSVLQYIYTNPDTNFIPSYFAGLDVVNPFFLQAMNILHMLMNLITLSGLFALLKPKGVLLYIGYYFLLAMLLGSSAF